MRKAVVAWIIFGICLVLVFAGIGWITRLVIRLDRTESEASSQAAREEKIRLALWRMDSAVAPIIGQENARPYFHYTSFYPAERAYGRMFSAVSPGETLLPSPLLDTDMPYVLLHFQMDSSRNCTSPQVPTGGYATLARRAGVPPARVDLHRTRQQNLVAVSAQLQLQLAEIPSNRRKAPQVVRVDEPVRKGPMKPGGKPDTAGNLPKGAGVSPEVERQKALTLREFDYRFANQMVANSIASQSQQISQSPLGPSGPRSQRAGDQRPDVLLNREDRSADMTQQRQRPAPSPIPAWVAGDSPLQAIWVGDALLLVRRIWVDQSEYVQGCWMDWPALKTNLLSSVRDLLPQADLVPVRSANGDGNPGVTLAALPVRLIAGPPPAVAENRLSALMLSLAVAWLCSLIGVGVAALVLRQALVLSERRGAFVSAVTHELRTPLTTFRMYTEMLVGGMATEEKDRQEFLGILQREAERLDHLVRNVLAYARLESTRSRTTLEGVQVSDLLDRCQDRLEQRMSEVGMGFRMEVDPVTRASSVKTDPAAVEQILFNLVDNAAKYARSATDRTVVLDARADERWLCLTVRDYGPGISAKQLRQLFKAFSKPASEAARTAPGVGLGLALSRRLARSLGGDLQLDPSVHPGACFVLKLPKKRP